MPRKFPIEDVISAAHQTFVTGGTAGVYLYMTGKEKAEDLTAEDCNACARKLKRSYKPLRYLDTRAPSYESLSARFSGWARRYGPALSVERLKTASGNGKLKAKPDGKQGAKPGAKYDKDGRPFDFRRRARDPQRAMLKLERGK